MFILPKKSSPYIIDIILPPILHLPLEIVNLPIPLLEFADNPLDLK